jgi:hypothetical protein
MREKKNEEVVNHNTTQNKAEMNILSRFIVSFFHLIIYLKSQCII